MKTARIIRHINMEIIKIIILILGIGGGTIGFNFIQKIKLNKIEKSHRKEINLKVDTIKTFRENIIYLQKQDSLKSEFIAEMQGTMNTIKKENTFLKRENQTLTAWKLDAQDGVVTDTVQIEYKTNIFGKRKRIK